MSKSDDRSYSVTEFEFKPKEEFLAQLGQWYVSEESDFAHNDERDRIVLTRNRADAKVWPLQFKAEECLTLQPKILRRVTLITDFSEKPNAK